MDRIELTQKVRKAQKGDIGAFKDLFTAYCRPLTCYVFRLIGSQDDAEDIVQEAMIKVYRSLGKLRHPERFHTWIYRIVTNQVRDRFDRGVIEVSMPANMNIEDLRDERYEQTEEMELVRQIIQMLPERLRMACILYYSVRKCNHLFAV